MELEGAIAALRAENSIRPQERDSATQNITGGTEEQNQEGSGSSRASPDRTYNKMVTEVSKATTHVVSYVSAEQTWHEQQEISKESTKSLMKKRSEP